MSREPSTCPKNPMEFHDRICPPLDNMPSVSLFTVIIFLHPSAPLSIKSVIIENFMGTSMYLVVERCYSQQYGSFLRVPLHGFGLSRLHSAPREPPDCSSAEGQQVAASIRRDVHERSALYLVLSYFSNCRCGSSRCLYEWHLFIRAVAEGRSVCICNI